VKTAKPTLRAKPPSRRELPDLHDPRLAAFLGGAERAYAEEGNTAAEIEVMEPPPALPWDDPAVRPDVTKLYNLRLPEGYLLKLRYIADHTPLSMQRFCLELLLPAIDEKIDQLIGRKA
jgi:hypothetical protein